MDFEQPKKSGGRSEPLTIAEGVVGPDLPVTRASPHRKPGRSWSKIKFASRRGFVRAEMEKKHAKRRLAWKGGVSELGWSRTKREYYAIISRCIG